MFSLPTNQAKLTQLSIVTFCLLIGTSCFQTSKDSTQMTYSNPYNLEFRSPKNSTIGRTGIPIHFNPNPKKIYEVTLDIQNSPMPLIPFPSTTISYYSPTEYNTNPVYSTNPGTALKVPISKINDNTYKFILIEDAILDEDYGLKHYGKKIGVSHWKMESNVFDISLSPTGKVQESYIRLMPFFNFANNLAHHEGSHTFFYEKKYVTTNPPFTRVDGSPNGWNIVKLTPDELKNINSSEIFSITVTVKKIN